MACLTGLKQTSSAFQALPNGHSYIWMPKCHFPAQTKMEANVSSTLDRAAAFVGRFVRLRFVVRSGKGNRHFLRSME